MCSEIELTANKVSLGNTDVTVYMMLLKSLAHITKRLYFVQNL